MRTKTASTQNMTIDQYVERLRYDKFRETRKTDKQKDLKEQQISLNDNYPILSRYIEQTKLCNTIGSVSVVDVELSDYI